MSKGSSRPPAKCHPGRPHYGLGMCSPCYHRSTEHRRRSECHPEKSVHAKGMCHNCYRKQSYIRDAKNKRRRRTRESQLASYGLKYRDYERMLNDQNGVCKICKQPPTKILEVDHCHSSGEVRGLLCGRCNTGLGMFRDSTTSLENAIRYLLLYDI